MMTDSSTLNDDSLRAQWRRSAECFNLSDSQLAALIAAVRSDRRTTALSQLAQRYKRFSILSLIMVAVIPLMLVSNLGGENFPWWIVAGFALYFLTAMVMDYWLYMGVSSIDCLTMDVESVIRKAWFYRKRHFQFMIVLLPMALMLVGAMAWWFSADRAVLYGIAFGFILGLAIGLRKLMDFLADYRRITTDK